MDVFKEILLILLISFSIFCLLMIGALGIVYLIEKNITCPNFEKAVNLPTKFNFLAGGCFVEINEGEWVRTKNYQGVNIK